MKKYVFLFIVMASMVIPVMAQEEYRQVYERKIQSFNRMKSAGWTMTGIGSGLAVVGTVLLVTLPDSYWYDETSYYDEDEDIEGVFQALGGIICLGVGVGLLAGGITMGSIGSHKVKSYKNKLNNLSLGMVCTPNKQGFSLTYRF